MPKFGTICFAEDLFGDERLNQVWRKKSIRRIPLGLTVRGTVRKSATDTSEAVTFRSRRGNGYYGSILGHIYQDKYKYAPGDPTASNCPEAAKTCFANAVASWAALSEAEKKIWTRDGSRRRNLPGRNYYISEYMKENYP